MKTAIRLVAAVFLAASVSAHAADPERTIDMTAVLHDENGRVMKDFTEQQGPADTTCEKCAPLTIGRAIDHTLKAVFPDEQGLSREQLWTRALLGDSVKNNKAAKLTVKEIEVIERELIKGYNGDVMKQIIPMLDPNRKPPELQ